jgi:hypothetical protein
MNRRTHGAATTLGYGLLFVLAGSALLLQEFDWLTIRWTFVLPLILTAVGASVLISGLAGAHHARTNFDNDEPEATAYHERIAP